MNKFDAINKVMVSDLKPEDKCLLVELFTRADEEWKCWPSVERLCKARGIKHEKNFKGADHYLPGLVTKIKRGRKNVYYINTPAVAGLSEAEVTIKHTNTPAVEGVNTPAVADNTPAVEGANTTSNTTEDITTLATAGAVSPVSSNLREGSPLNLEEVEVSSGFRYFLSSSGVTRSLNSTSTLDTPATEGVLHEWDGRTAADWRAIRLQRPLTRDEKEYIDAKARAYKEAERAKQPEPV